jgi:hypothetical protein
VLPTPPSAGCNVVVDEAALVVFTDTLSFDVVTADCAIGSDVVETFELNPSPPVTPGLVVGNVTEPTGATVASEAVGVVDDLASVVVVLVAVGQMASMMPPFFTTPSNVFEFTETPEHALLTLFAIEFSAA